MKMCMRAICMMVVGIVMPKISFGQTLAGEMSSLHGVLDQLYSEMMPLCSDLISVGRGIAGFAATFYIGSRIWRHIANAEPVDFYPLFRPFVLGFAIGFFPLTIQVLNSILEPTVAATGDMVQDSNKAIATLLKQKDERIKETDDWKMYVGETKEGNRDLWYKYTHENADPSEEGMLESIGN